MAAQNLKLLSVEVTDSKAWFFDLKGSYYVARDEIGSKSSQSGLRIRPTEFIEHAWAMSDANGLVYFATPGGCVSAYPEHSAINGGYPASLWSGYVDEAIFAIESDSLGRPWVATSGGLWLRHDNGSFRLEIKTSGSDSIAIDYGASHADSKGNLYFGGTGGLITIRNPTHYPITASGSLIIRTIKVNERYVEFEDASENENRLLSLDGRNDTILIELGTKKFLTRETVRYQHKLEGFDTDWQDSGNINSVTYQNLPPGNYTFRARGADSMGVWSDNEITLPIEVLPPYWKTWWAFLSYFIFAVLLFAYFKRLNDRYISHRERLRLAEEGSAAFARLEDDYQAQREANEVLLQRRAPSANRLLDVVETALSAQDTEVGDRPATLALANKLQTLRELQTLTTRTTSEEHTNLHALADEIAARLAESNPQAARAIITNAICKDLIPVEHATYLALVIQEVLELAATGRKFDNAVDPMIYICMASPTVNEAGDYAYELRVDDSALEEIGSDRAADNLLPLTFHLIESGGGEIKQHYDAGNTLSITLLFAPQSGGYA